MWIGCLIISFYVISFMFTALGNLLKGIFPYLLAFVFIIGAAFAIYELYKTIIEGKDLIVKFFPKKTVKEKPTEYSPEEMYGTKHAEPELAILKAENAELFCTNCGSAISKEVSFCTSCGATNTYKVEN